MADWSWGSGKTWISKVVADWIEETYPGLLTAHGNWGYPAESDPDQRCVCVCGFRLETYDDAGPYLFEHVAERVARRLETEKVTKTYGVVITDATITYQELTAETVRHKAAVKKMYEQRRRER